MPSVTVKSGDSLSSIASQYGTTVNNINSLNNLKTDVLQIGQVLILPGTPAPVHAGTAKWFYPVRPWSHYNNDVGKFLDPVYYQIIHAEHPGNDLNGDGGGNTDFNDPIYAASDGTVIDATFYPVWGNMVAIYHPADNLTSVYAHLNAMRVHIGQVVRGSEQIGNMGRGANNRYFAHLHFEIRYGRLAGLATNFWPTSHFPDRTECQTFIRAHYQDAIKFLESKNAS